MRTLPRAPRSFVLAFVAALALVALPACSDDDDDDDIRGTWLLEQNGYTAYVEITAGRFTVAGRQEPADCFIRFDLDIVDVDGDEYTLEFVDGPGTDITIELRREGDVLVLTNEEGGEVRYERTDVDVDDLNVCDPEELPGDFDPELASCTSYPSITLGQPVAESLASGDDADGGFFYDAYRLELADATSLTITLASDEIDPYLRLYDAAGALVIENDDFGSTDSRVDIDIPAGCYVVVASSFGTGESGSYLLSVDTP